MNYLLMAAGASAIDPIYADFIVPLPRRLGVSVCNLGSILNWIINEELVPYGNNRGVGRLSVKTMESARNGVLESSLGECTIGKDENGVWTMADFHSRSGGFLQRYVDGNMSVRELKSPVSVRVVSDLLESYQRLNAGDRHLSKDKIVNPDLAFGPSLEFIKRNVSADCMLLIGDNKWTVLSSMLLNLATESKDDWTWAKVYQKRMIATKIANERAGYFQINKSDLVKLIAGINYWFELMTALKNEATSASNVTPRSIKKIINNAGLFGFVVCDRMWARPHFSTQRVMVNKMIRELSTLEKACPELCRGNRNSMLTWSNRLYEIFNSRPRSPLAA